MHPAHRGVLDALVSGLSEIEDPLAVLYRDLVLAALPETARHYLEDLMAIDLDELFT